jgi:glycosyltransferase involved in cell wall biosynthesis
MGIPKDKLVYSDYAFPMESFSHVQTRIPQTPLRFGYVGQLRPHKGIEVLLKAFAGFMDAELYIYGEPIENFWENYRALASQGNVHYEGPLSEENKAATLARLDALIVPSIWYENSPLVIHEAFMAKLPVITSNVGGMAELVPDGICGVQFQVGDPMDLRRKLAGLCKSPERILRLRANIPSVKEIGVHVQELLTYYNQLLR